MHALRFAVLVLALAVESGAARSAAAPQVSGCLEGGCHHELLDRGVVHRPVAEGACGSCHVLDPQGAAAPDHHAGHVGGDLAPARHGRAACAGCHRPLPPAHPVAGSAESDPCLRCHDPHGGDTRADLRGDEEQVCGRCHEAALAGSRSTPRFGGKDDSSGATPESHRHGPLAQGRCGDCHRAHGASPEERLGGTFPVGAYATYAADRYSACLGACHGKDVVEAVRTRSATAFRNGERNLHRVHVVDPPRGRSCRLCHDSHAATNAALLRGAMPFGRELLTLDFEARPNGGRCTTSCHMPLEYDREQAVPSRMRTVSPVPPTERP